MRQETAVLEIPETVAFPEEMRRFERQDVHRSASVIDVQSGREYSCVVTNASLGGVRVSAMSFDGIGEYVQLVVEGIETPIPAKVAWRDAEEGAGLTFGDVAGKLDDGAGKPTVADGGAMSFPERLGQSLAWGSSLLGKMSAAFERGKARRPN